MTDLLFCDFHSKLYNFKAENKAIFSNIHQLQLIKLHHLKIAKIVNLYKCSIFAITETQFAIQTGVILQPNCTKRLHVGATIIRSFRKSYFHVFYRQSVPGTLAISGHASYQIGKMPALLLFINYFSCLLFCFCLTTVSNIMIILL